MLALSFSATLALPPQQRPGMSLTTHVSALTRVWPYSHCSPVTRLLGWQPRIRRAQRRVVPWRRAPRGRRLADGQSPTDNGPLSAYFDQRGRDDVLGGGARVISIATPKGTFHVWTKRVGNNPRIKVLILHGGPGMTHEAYEAFDSYLPGAGIEYYYYDQLGSAYSDQPHDASLWELRSLRRRSGTGAPCAAPRPQ